MFVRFPGRVGRLACVKPVAGGDIEVKGFYRFVLDQGLVCLRLVFFGWVVAGPLRGRLPPVIW